MPKKMVGIMVDNELLAEIDLKRGSIPRSTYVRDLIIRSLSKGEV